MSSEIWRFGDEQSGAFVQGRKWRWGVTNMFTYRDRILPIDASIYIYTHLNVIYIYCYIYITKYSMYIYINIPCISIGSILYIYKYLNS